MGLADTAAPPTTAPPAVPQTQWDIPCPMFTSRDSLGYCDIWGSAQYQRFAEMGGLAIAAALLPGWYKAIPIGVLLYALGKPGNGPLLSFT